MSDAIGAAGELPAWCGTAGGAAALIPGTQSAATGRHAKAAATLRAIHADPVAGPALKERLSIARRVPPDVIARIGEMAAEGIASEEMARALRLNRTTICKIRKRNGWHAEKDAGMERGAVVLRAHYATTMEPAELRRLYCEARGRDICISAMGEHANRLGLYRPPEMRNKIGANRGAQATSAKRQAARVDLATRAQPLLDAGMSMAEAAAALHVSTNLIGRLRREDLIRVTVRYGPRPGARAMAPPPPKKLPPSYVRAPAPPSLPTPTYQTVEAWLAAGNAITRCPAAMSVPTSADLSAADMAAMHALYAQRTIDAKKARPGDAYRLKGRLIAIEAKRRGFA